jgi:hypothetical protein
MIFFYQKKQYRREKTPQKKTKARCRIAVLHENKHWFLGFFQCLRSSYDGRFGWAARFFFLTNHEPAAY